MTIKKEAYPLAPTGEYLDVLARYKDIPNIRTIAKKAAPEKNKPKESFWKMVFSVKTLINVWLPTVMTVTGTLGGAIIGAKYNTPSAPKHKPKTVLEEQAGAVTNLTTYVYTNPVQTNIQFAVVGDKKTTPKAYWITTNNQGLKEVAVATQTDQVVLTKE